MKDKIGKLLILFIFVSALTAAGVAQPSWSRAPLQGNDGISNLLTLYDEMESGDGLTNNQISTFLTLYNCRESGVSSVGECMSQEGSNIVHPDEYVSVEVLPYNDISLGDSDDTSDEQKEDPLVTDYLYLESADFRVDEVWKETDVPIDIEISKTDIKDIGATPTVELLKEGHTVANKEVNWDQDTVTFDWEDVWTGDNQYNAEFGLVLQRNTQGDYWWNRSTAEIGTLDIVRCGEGYVYSEFHDQYSNTAYDGCIEENDDLEESILGIQERTGWQLKTENSVIHTLKSVSGEEFSGREELSIHTGEEGFCGRAYFENEYIGGEDSFSVEAKMYAIGDIDRLGWHQTPQTFFVEVNGETVVENDIDYGSSKTFQPEADAGDTVRVGIKGEPSPPLFGCNSWDSRTHVDIDVEGSFENYDSSRREPPNFQ
jgi:hypothetical protein